MMVLGTTRGLCPWNLMTQTATLYHTCHLMALQAANHARAVVPAAPPDHQAEVGAAVTVMMSP